MRNGFDQQLELLHMELIQMGALCEEAISAATKALIDGDEALRLSVRGIEEEIDRKERSIESLCLNLLLRQQPVAGDLRAVSSALKMISDMERIGDQAADVSDIIPHLDNREILSSVPIAEMARITVGMVRDSVESFVRRDLDLVNAVKRTDDEVDALFFQVKENLIALISKGDNAHACLDVLMIAKYFERIGDHAVNIAEWVEFSLTGLHIDGAHI